MYVCCTHDVLCITYTCTVHFTVVAELANTKCHASVAWTMGRAREALNCVGGHVSSVSTHAHMHICTVLYCVYSCTVYIHVCTVLYCVYSYIVYIHVFTVLYCVYSYIVYIHVCTVLYCTILCIAVCSASIGPAEPAILTVL